MPNFTHQPVSIYVYAWFFASVKNCKNSFSFLTKKNHKQKSGAPLYSISFTVDKEHTFAIYIFKGNKTSIGSASVIFTISLKAQLIENTRYVHRRQL